MKSLLISKAKKSQFLQAAKVVDVKVSEKHLVKSKSKSCFEISDPNVTQQQIFELGVYYALYSLK